MNVKLLQKVGDRILAAPKLFQMPRWSRPITDRNGEVCGTACCIGGDAILLSGARVNNDGDFLPTKRLEAKLAKSSDVHADQAIYFSNRLQAKQVDAYTAARMVLGLTIKQSDRLFALGEWPEKFQVAYRTARGDRGRARAGYNRIQHFIKTNGAE